jgi:hypothetical protein
MLRKCSVSYSDPGRPIGIMPHGRSSMMLGAGDQPDPVADTIT